QLAIVIRKFDGRAGVRAAVLRCEKLRTFDEFPQGLSADTGKHRLRAVQKGVWFGVCKLRDSLDMTDHHIALRPAKLGNHRQIVDLFEVLYAGGVPMAELADRPEGRKR